jgi:hypothetical protein
MLKGEDMVKIFAVFKVEKAVKRTYRNCLTRSDQ